MTAMTAATATGTATTTTAGSRRLVRAACVAAAGLANGAVFAACRAGGVEFTTTDATGEHPFPLSGIVLISVVFGLLGWATLAGLERWTRRPVLIWSVLATAVVLLSMVPIALIDASAGTKAALAVIHVVVALALLPMLRRR